ncbi:MAG: hypothetical protein IT310_07180, partial [Anaerolineales bacterium]|nr:hypothetical protein [Anaerolineales bacterium]
MEANLARKAAERARQANQNQHMDAKMNAIDAADEAEWNRVQSVLDLRAVLAAQARQNAQNQYMDAKMSAIDAADEAGWVAGAVNSLPNLLNTRVTPLINSLAEQWNQFVDNATSPVNPTGPLLNLSPSMKSASSLFNSTSTLLDFLLFNGQIAQTAQNLSQTLQSY